MGEPPADLALDDGCSEIRMALEGLGIYYDVEAVTLED